MLGSALLHKIHQLHILHYVHVEIAHDYPGRSLPLVHNEVSRQKMLLLQGADLRFCYVVEKLLTHILISVSQKGHFSSYLVVALGGEIQ